MKLPAKPSRTWGMQRRFMIVWWKLPKFHVAHYPVIFFLCTRQKILTACNSLIYHSSRFIPTTKNQTLTELQKKLSCTELEDFSLPLPFIDISQPIVRLDRATPTFWHNLNIHLLANRILRDGTQNLHFIEKFTLQS